MRFNKLADDVCKWAVSTVTFAVTIHNSHHDARTVVVPLYVGGAISCALVGKMLKTIVNQGRPAGSQKLDPGMPSSHGNALAFLSIAAAIGVARQCGVAALSDVGGMSTSELSACLALVAIGIYLSILRVTEGHHTVPQVLAGYALGVCGVSSLTWLNYGGYGGASPGGRVDDLPLTMRHAVNFISCALSCTFAMKVVFKWARKKK